MLASSNDGSNFNSLPHSSVIFGPFKLRKKKPGGFGLDDILIQKSKMLRFSGIQNAIDDEWDPRTDPWPRS